MWKKNRWKILTAAAVAALLVFAFWYGGDAPGLRGWSVKGGGEEAPDIFSDGTEQAANGPQEEAAPPETEGEPGDAGGPAPMEPGEAEITEDEYGCTLYISCGTVLDNMEWLDGEKAELIPEDGVMLAKTEVTFFGGESVFNVLRRTCKQLGIHLEFSRTPMYESAYIEGIGNLYEFDCGERSGWMYSVNGWFPNYGSSKYALEDGDEIKVEYTCDLGEDIGGGYAAGQQR